MKSAHNIMKITFIKHKFNEEILKLVAKKEKKNKKKKEHTKGRNFADTTKPRELSK